MTPIPAWQKRHDQRTKGRTLYTPTPAVRQREAEARRQRSGRRLPWWVEAAVVAGLALVFYALAIAGSCRP